MRAIPIRSGRTSSKNEEGDLFRCPRCGFVNNWSKTSRPGYAGIYIGDASVASDPVSAVEEPGLNVAMCTLEAVDFHGYTVKVGDDGTNGIGTYYTTRYYQPNAGCRFCGRVNL